MRHKERVVVVGAGISGLSCAYRLKQLGIGALVLKAKDRFVEVCKVRSAIGRSAGERRNAGSRRPRGHDSSGLCGERAFQSPPVTLLLVGRRQRGPGYIRHHVASSIDESDICRLHQ